MVVIFHDLLTKYMVSKYFSTDMNKNFKYVMQHF